MQKDRVLMALEDTAYIQIQHDFIYRVERDRIYKQILQQNLKKAALIKIETMFFRVKSFYEKDQ